MTNFEKIEFFSHSLRSMLPKDVSHKKKNGKQPEKQKDDHDTSAKTWLCYVSDFPEQVRNTERSLAEMGIKI